MTCPAALYRSEHGLVTAAMAGQIRALVPGSVEVEELVGAGHHPMLDRPQELVAALSARLEAWGA